MDKRNARQDLVNFFLGIWAVVTPWVIGNHPAAGVAADYGIAGVLIAFFACAALIAFRPWQEGINVWLGAWLVVSPWMLGLRANSSLMWSAVLVGVLVVFCSELSLLRKQSQNL